MSNQKRKPSQRPFLQPLVLAGVCLFFVALLLTLAAVDLRTLDKTLTAHVERSGADFIKAIQETANINLERTNHVPEWGFDGSGDAVLGDQRPSLQEGLVMTLLQLAQHLEHQMEKGTSTREEPAAFTSVQGLWRLVLLSKRGELVYEEIPVPDSVRQAVFSMIRDHRDLGIHLFDNLHAPEFLRFLVLRRNHNRGFLVLLFDRKAFRFWRLKTALEMAVSAVGIPSNTDCLMIEDNTGLTLFQSGDCLDANVEGNSTSGAFEKLKQMIDTKIFWKRQSRMLPVERTMSVEGAHLTTRLHLNTESLSRTVEKERRWRMIAMGFMVFMAVLSMWFLYRNQNRHVARLQQMEKRLHRAERLSAMGRLASGVAHEIRNPLNAISMACQRLRADNLDQLSPVIKSEIRRLNAIIEEFLGLSKGRRLKLEWVDLAELVNQVALLMDEEAHQRGVEVHAKGTEAGLMVWLDESKIRQASINMVKNAMEAIKGNGTVTLEVSRKGKSLAVVTISDTGEGLAEEDVDKIFNLDFTTKEQGLGLGLALAHEVIQAHGGEIRVKSERGRGTSFVILLPMKNGNRSK